MNRTLQHHVTRIDRALLALVNERARLVRELQLTERDARASVEDLLRRSDGPLEELELRALFAAIERATTSASSEAAR